MESAIVKAVVLFRSSQEMDDGEIHRVLVDFGIDSKSAARLVELVPMAYCRALLENTGAHFPETFQRYRIDGTVSPATPLISEPIWQAALDYARREIERGISLNQKLRVAGRSAEFKAANELLHKGSKLEDLRFAPPIFVWPEEGPDTPSGTG